MIEKKVEYKPLSVKTLLTSIKNISELTVDLAYSAVLFNDAELREEVLELEEYVDYLIYLLFMSASFAVRDREDAEMMAGIMKLAMAANRISDAAGDIASTIVRGEGLKILTQAFSKTEERVMRLTVNKNSPLCNKKIDSLKGQLGVDVIAIKRKGRLLINPKENSKLIADDVVIVRGTDKSVQEFKKMAEGGC
ncbi:MAG: TrkA C-terminal domain-containing protein [Candidatus Jordarchaeales archaeon]